MIMTTVPARPALGTAGQRCVVCDKPAAERVTLTECCECGGWFHLDLAAGGEELSCGAVTVGQACGWNAACEPCLQHIEAATAHTRA